MPNTFDHAFFYNSENGDRKYDAESFEYWLKKFFTSGVFNGDLQATTAGSMTIEVSGGYANADGKVKLFASEERFTLETAHATYDRIDTVVVERNDALRDVVRKVITGGYSSNPAPTPPVREAGVYQLVVGQIYVAHGAVAVSPEMITDTRMDSSVCGYVTGTVQEMDFSGFQAQFMGWFDSIKDILDEDAAGHLLNLIEQLQQNKLDKSGGSFTGDVSMGNHKLTDLITPVAAGDAVPKSYADSGVQEAKDYTDGKKRSLSVSLPAAGWVNNQQTVTATGVTASNDVIVAPSSGSFTAYGEALVHCTAQGANSLTFACDSVPEANLTVNILILN